MEISKIYSEYHNKGNFNPTECRVDTKIFFLIMMSVSLEISKLISVIHLANYGPLSKSFVKSVCKSSVTSTSRSIDIYGNKHKPE